jgi:hypothetical protein
MKGSVVKRCSCPPAYNAKGERLACKLKHGSWSFVADAGRDPKTGKRRQIKRGGYATKAEAETALTDLADQANKGMITHDDRQTVAVYLETWLAGKVANGLRPTTARSYSQHINDYLVPELGHLRLRDLRGTHVEAMLAVVQRPKPKGKTLSPRIGWAPTSSCARRAASVVARPWGSAGTTSTSSAGASRCASRSCNCRATTTARNAAGLTEALNLVRSRPNQAKSA